MQFYLYDKLSVSDSTMREIIKQFGQLEDFLSFMAKRNTDRAMRQKYGTAALKLFVGEGGSYALAGVAHSGATIEQSSINSLGRETCCKMHATTYFNQLIAMAENGRRVRLDIKSATIYLLATSTLELVGDSLYKAKCWICNYNPRSKRIPRYDCVQEYIITRLNISEPMPSEIILWNEVPRVWKILNNRIFSEDLAKKVAGLKGFEPLAVRLRVERST